MLAAHPFLGRSAPSEMARLQAKYDPDCHRVSASFAWRRLPFCALAIAISVLPLRAQRTRYTPNFGAAGRPPMSVVHNWNFDSYGAADEEACFPWKLSPARSTTVSVEQLKIPPKARAEYDKACDASNGSKFDEAEQHARSAIAAFRDYSAAWVMLGLILEQQRKPQEARDACTHAAGINATYLPAHLCAAEVSARNREWAQVLSSANTAAGLRSEGDPYAYYYRAMAYLHMSNTAEAKKSALQALEIDTTHEETSLYFLLALIYEREGDRANAIAQLQQFLKRPSDKPREDAAKQILAKLESQQPSK